MYLLDRLLILVAYVDNLQNVVVGMKCSRTDVDLYIVLQERYCQRLHFLRPSGTPHQSLTVRLFTTNKQPACTVSQLCVALILKSFVQFSGYFFYFLCTHTHIHTYIYDRPLHRWVQRWANSPILDEQILLHWSESHDVLLTTWCLRAALCGLATCASSKAAMAVRHIEHHCPLSGGALTSECGYMSHIFKLSLTVSVYRLTGLHCGHLPDESCP